MIILDREGLSDYTYGIIGSFIHDNSYHVELPSQKKDSHEGNLIFKWVYLRVHITDIFDFATFIPINHTTFLSPKIKRDSASNEKKEFPSNRELLGSKWQRFPDSLANITADAVANAPYKLHSCSNAFALNA